MIHRALLSRLFVFPAGCEQASADRPAAQPVAKGAKEAPWERKLRKLLRDPQGFALDTKVGKSVSKLLRSPSGARKS